MQVRLDVDVKKQRQMKVIKGIYSSNDMFQMSCLNLIAIYVWFAYEHEQIYLYILFSWSVH